MFRVATKINLFREFLLVDKLIFLRSVYIRPTRELLVVPSCSPFFGHNGTKGHHSHLNTS